MTSFTINLRIFIVVVVEAMSSESAEPSWLRLGDLAIGDGGVCVTSLIKDKIREYMLNEGQQQTTTTATAIALTTATAVSAGAATKTSTTTSGGGGTCVRRIGNSLDLLLRESRNAGHAVAAARTKTPTASVTAVSTTAALADDRCTVSTTVCAPADSSRPTVDPPNSRRKG